MRRADKILIGVVVAFAAFIVYAALNAPRAAPEAVAQAPAPSEAAATSPNEIVASKGTLPAPPRDINAIRRQLQAHENGTFIGEILAARDSNIARWPERREHAITVWIDEHSPIVAPELQLPAQVRRAFADWGTAGVPLAFTFIGDSAPAEVHVVFIDHFATAISGRTLWTRDPNWWIIAGDIQLSLRSGSGHLLTPDQVYAIALHEVGHLLGLDHTSDTTAVMAPHLRVLQLTPIDIATMRLIYELPPGTVKKP